MLSSGPMSVNLYTDGSVCTEKKVGGWAFVTTIENNNTEKSGVRRSECDANRMELLAVKEGLEIISPEHENIKLFSDSLYVRDVLDALRNGQKIVPRILRRNGDVHQAIATLLGGRRILFQQVRTHNSWPEQHHRCHELAREAIFQMQ